MSAKIDNRIWMLITVLVCGALLAAAWFLGAQPFVAQAAAAADQQKAVDQKNSTTMTTIAALAAAKKDLPTLKATAADLENSVPYTLGGSSFIRAVTDLAASSGVSVSAIKIEDPVPYTTPEAKSATTAGPAVPGATPSAAPTASASPSPTPTVDAAVAAATPYSNPLIGSADLVVVPFSVEVAGPQESLLGFTKALQQGKRLVLITSIGYSTASDGANSQPKITLGGNLYVLTTTAAAAGASANG